MLQDVAMTNKPLLPETIILDEASDFSNEPGCFTATATGQYSLGMSKCELTEGDAVGRGFVAPTGRYEVEAPEIEGFTASIMVNGEEFKGNKVIIEAGDEAFPIYRKKQ